MNHDLEVAMQFGLPTGPGEQSTANRKQLLQVALADQWFGGRQVPEDAPGRHGRESAGQLKAVAAVEQADA